MGNIVKRASEGILVFVLEPGPDVLDSILLKNVRKLNYLICREFVKNVIPCYSLNQYLLSLMCWVALALCLLNGFVVLCFALCMH